ncbi:hypothetical protein AAG747_28155 [Rapidithrix thailandica]|uniref:EcxA zinc-binding domain-containing protein n=1 Tax=Rapidithrix thailandica TaxID=413964 RepID=A0AAW9S6E7_9BACT
MFKVSETGNPGNYILVKPLEIADPPFVVSFFRSKDHANGKYGDRDNFYRGTFGFDRFDNKVIAEGLVEHYPPLEGIETDRKTVENSRAYFCPYLSLWPPQVDGNQDSAKSKVSIFVRLEKSSHYNSDPDKIRVKFRSADAKCVTVNGKAEDIIELDLKAGKEEHPSIEIECHQAFDKELAIDAITYQKGSDEHVVGKLLLYPNKVRYKTLIQPVRLVFGPTESKTIGSENHRPLFQNLVKDFNEISFNQAYIHAELAPQTKVVTLSMSQFKNDFGCVYRHHNDGKDYLKEGETYSGLYNELVETRYAALASQKKAQLNRVEIGEELVRKMQVMVNTFYAHFKEYKVTKNPLRIKKEKEAKIVETTWNQPEVQTAYQDFAVTRKLYGELPEEDASAMDKKHKIHLFFTDDIYGHYKRVKLSNGKFTDGKAVAYSVPMTGVVHIFEATFQKQKVTPTILHEMGHSLGLDHTFSKALGEYEYKDPNKDYKDDLEKKLKELRNEKDDLESNLKDFIQYKKLIEKEKVTQSELLDLLGIEKLYYSVLELLRNSLTTGRLELDGLSPVEGFVRHVQNAIKAEHDNWVDIRPERLTKEQTQTRVEELETEIAYLELRLKTAGKAESLSKKQDQSATLENYMDYDYRAVDGKVVPEVERKLFYKWQWDKVRKIGSEEGYFKEQN